MAQTGYIPIQLYYSTTPAAEPSAVDLRNGELALNITDGKLYYKDNLAAVQVLSWKTTPISAGGTGQTTQQAALDALAGATTSGYYLRGNGSDVVMSAIQAADVPTLNQNTTGTASNVTGIVAVSNGGSGTATPSLIAGANVTVTGAWPNQTIATSGGPADVVGPASATDNALARFDGTTGKLIQNSTVTLDDNGNVINTNSVGFDTTPGTLPTSAGTLSWDDGEGVPAVILKGGNTTLQVGTQEYARVYNDSGTALTKGQVVYISGAQGNRVAVKLARADVEATSFGTIGLVSESIANGAEGFIIVSGALYKLNTSGFTAGAAVYLSPTTAGAITTTKPQAPDQLVVLGWVERVDNNVGSIYVKVDNGYELEELHDVQVNSPASGNLLIYDASTTPIGVWKNANLTAGTGVSVTNGAGSITLANTGVTSLTGTTNEIDVSAATGAITLSLPVTINANTTGSAATLTTGRTIAITGDLAYTSPSFNGSTNVTAAGTLATVNANVGSFTNASVTVNAKGLVTAASSGTAPVTSVTGTSPVASSGGTTPAISLSAGYGDTLNPYASKTANYFLAAPNGSAGVPTFRAIVAADIPALSYVASTGGTASGLTLNDGYTEEVFAVTGTTPALSPTNGSIQTWTLSANSTPTAGTWAAGQSITLMVDDGTAFAITWTSLPVTWETNSGAAPSLSTTGYTPIVLWKVGTTIYGARVGNA